MKIYVLSGPYEGNVYEFDYDIVVGRDSSVDLSFALDLSISRKHLKISQRDKSILLEDLNSTNGTFIIQKGKTERVQGSREIINFPLFLRIGNSVILIEI
ncbi:MAG: FHA domain-containing protein [bacterium]